MYNVHQENLRRELANSAWNATKHEHQ